LYRFKKEEGHRPRREGGGKARGKRGKVAGGLGNKLHLEIMVLLTFTLPGGKGVGVNGWKKDKWI